MSKELNQNELQNATGGNEARIVVHPGCTLGEIASMYGTPTDAIVKLNKAEIIAEANKLGLDITAESDFVDLPCSFGVRVK